jgi:hypothetical protein
MIVIQTEHWSSGSAAAIFPDRETAEAAASRNKISFEHLDDVFESEKPLESLISEQTEWLKNSERRIGYAEQNEEITPWPLRMVTRGVFEHMEDYGALWSGCV